MEDKKNTYNRISDNIERIIRIDFEIWSNNSIIENSAISDINCICIISIKIIVHKKEADIAKLLKNKQGKQRFQEIKALTKNVTHCQRVGCGIPAHKISIDKKNGNVFIIAEAVKRPSDDETGE